MRGLLGVALLSVGAKALINSAGFTIDPNYVTPNSKVYPPLGPNWPTKAPVSGSTYDYIVVGSGPGGGPVAARLALAGHSVLLIDAGEDHSMDRQVQVPALHPFASAYNPIRWSYFVSHYDDPVQAARDSKMTYLTPAGQWYTGLYPPRGSKMLGINYPRTGALGGCAAHNAMITVYPYRNDWDYIANLTGDDSWGADNMRTYFEKLERCEYLPNSVVGHGFTGWLPTQVTPPILIAEDLKVASILLAACRTIGKTFLTGLVTTVTGLAELLTQDINSGLPGRDRGEEIYQIPLAMDGINYSRASPRDFVVAVASARKADGTPRYKLDIALNTLVTRVTFDKASGGKGGGAPPRANGVDYLFGRSMYRADTRAGGVPNGVVGHVRAAKEVIVSAGSFNTPQLLKLSGVGPAAELARFNIPLVHDLPGVGGNLQDRYEIAVVTQADSQFSLLKPCKFVAAGKDDPCFDQWNTLPGPLKGAYTTNGIAFGYLHHSSQAQGPNDDPDLYLGGVPANFPGYYPEYATEAVKGLDTWSWFALKAHSRNNAGSVNLTSADPRDMPAVHFRSYAKGGEQDLQALVEGLQWGFRALDNIIPLDGTFKRIWPPLNVSTDAELKQFARDESWGHHASCTCPIGADDDPMAVLDSQFRVRGVSGLRVVDASAFPKIPGTYIALPIYMISEKLADVLGA